MELRWSNRRSRDGAKPCERRLVKHPDARRNAPSRTLCTSLDGEYEVCDAMRERCNAQGKIMGSTGFNQYHLSRRIFASWDLLIIPPSKEWQPSLHDFGYSSVATYSGLCCTRDILH